MSRLSGPEGSGAGNPGGPGHMASSRGRSWLYPWTLNLGLTMLHPSTFNLQPSTFNLQPSTFNLGLTTLQPPGTGMARPRQSARMSMHSRLNCDWPPHCNVKPWLCVP